MIVCKKIDKNFYILEINPSGENNIVYKFTLKRSELYELYTILRGFFQD